LLDNRFICNENSNATVELPVPHKHVRHYLKDDLYIMERRRRRPYSL